MSLTGARMLELFLSIKLHLSTDSYDFFQYNGKLRPQKHSVWAESLATKLKTEANAIDFLVANHIKFRLESGKFCSFIGDFGSKDNLYVWAEYVQRQNKLRHLISQDISNVVKRYGSVNALKDVKNVVQMLYSGEIGIFTIVYSLKHFRLYKHWAKEFDPIAEEDREFFLRLKPFFKKLDEKEFIEIVKSGVALTK